MNTIERRHNIINNYLKRKRSAWILGSGTSLHGFNFNKLDKEFTIAVNHTIEFYPKASCLIFGDKTFLKHSDFDLNKYKGLIFASTDCEGHERLKGIDKDRLFIFQKRKDEPQINCKLGLFHPTSSGMMAMNLALCMRAKKIFLLGFDYYHKGTMHFYGDKYEHHTKYSEKKTAAKLVKFRKFEKYSGLIFNLNKDSHIEEFVKRDISEVFK